LTVSKSFQRFMFLESCASETHEIHWPILNTKKIRGHLNPAGLGNAREFSEGSLGQTSVAFDTIEDYEHADATGTGYEGSAEYAIVRTPEAAQVTKKFAELHGGKGAVILPSGLSAISTVFETFLKGSKPTILIPDNRYFPAERALKHLNGINPHLGVYRYTPRASADEILKMVATISSDGRKVDMIYLEAPGSQTFEIPDLKRIIEFAKSRKILTVMDNTWASHVRFKPLAAGIDVVVEATTKYPGGYADTPSGIIVSASEENHRKISYTARVNGNGAVSPQTCNRLFNRVASTEERLNKHFASAQRAMTWFQAQPFTQDILCPANPRSPDNARFHTYFHKGNGLFTVRFKEAVTKQAVHDFVGRLNLFRVAESWGSHVSLVLPAHASRALETSPQPGERLRFSMGLENGDDLERDYSSASLALGY